LEAGDTLSLSRASGSSAGSNPATCSATTTNDVSDGLHTHQISASSDPGEAVALLKTNADGELTLEWLDVTWDCNITRDVWIGRDLEVDGDLDIGSGSEYLKLSGGYLGLYTTQYSYMTLQQITSGFDETHEVWDFNVLCSNEDVLDGFGGHFTYCARTESAGESPAVARSRWWLSDATHATYKGAWGIALFEGDGGSGDGTEELVLSLIAGGDHTLKLQDNAGSNKLSIVDSDDAEVASIDSDGNAQFDGLVDCDGGVATVVATDNVSDPPSDAELDSAFGEPGTVGAGFVGILDDNDDATDCYMCWTDGSAWFFTKGTKAT